MVVWLLIVVLWEGWWGGIVTGGLVFGSLTAVGMLTTVKMKVDRANNTATDVATVAPATTTRTVRLYQGSFAVLAVSYWSHWFVRVIRVGCNQQSLCPCPPLGRRSGPAPRRRSLGARPAHAQAVGDSSVAASTAVPIVVGAPADDCCWPGIAAPIAALNVGCEVVKRGTCRCPDSRG